MKLYRNTMIGWRYKSWSCQEAIAYFIKGIARELKIAPDFFLNWYETIVINRFKKKWLVTKNNVSFFDFNGAKLPNVSDNPDNLKSLVFPIFLDTFLFYCYNNDDYSRDRVLRLDPYMIDGVYGYTDRDFDVTVKKGDIVIDAGAWIGDFSAYAASKGANVYAFEPVRKNFELLCQTKDLNNMDGEGQIYPVQKGLGYSECEIDISVDTGACEGSSFIMDRETGVREKISVTTLDRFVEEN